MNSLVILVPNRKRQLLQLHYRRLLRANSEARNPNLQVAVTRCVNIPFATLLRLKQGQVSKHIFENDAIRKRISNDFDKRCICQLKAQ